MRIPIYCPTCQKFYPGTEWDFEESSSIKMDNITTECPFGHAAVQADVTIDLHGQLQIIHKQNPKKLEKIREIASGVANEEIDPIAALSAISTLSPELSAIISTASGKNLSLKAILIWIFVCISAIAGGTAMTAKFVQDVRTIFGETSPTPDIVINNDITIINKIAARNIRNGSVPNALTKEQIRKQKQVAKKNKKRKDKKGKKLRRQQSTSK